MNDGVQAGIAGSRLATAATRQALPLMLIIAVIFVALIGVGFAYRLDKAHPSYRFIFHAIPAALSVDYFGWPHDYTANFNIAMRFQSLKEPLQQTIDDVLKNKASLKDTRPYFWVADDRGSLDIIAAGFYLFGPNIESMFYFYFVMLGFSVLAFCIAHRRGADALRGAAISLLSLGVSLAIWYVVNNQHSGMTGFREGAINLAENRMYGILAFFPVLSLFFLVVQRSPATVLEIAAAAAQAALFAVLIHARSSVMWLLFPLAFIAVAGLLPRFRLLQRRNALTALVVVTVAFAGKSIYQHESYHPDYFGEKGSRTLWHNIVMGLANDPFFETQLGVRTDDATAISLVLRYAKTGTLLPGEQHLTDEEDQALKRQTTTALNALGSHVRYDWSNQDRVARHYLLGVIKAYPFEFVKTYAWYKLRDTVVTAVTLIFSSRNFNLPDHSGFPLVYPIVFATALVTIAGFFGFGGIPDRRTLQFFYSFLALCAIFSAAAPILVYPAYVTVADLVMIVVVLWLMVAYDLAVRFREATSGIGQSGGVTPHAHSGL